MEREAGTGFHKHLVGLKSTGLAHQIGMFLASSKQLFSGTRMYGRVLVRMNKILLIEI
jgi:hypothetical protein